MVALLVPAVVIVESLIARDWLAAAMVWLGGSLASGVTRASSKHSPIYAVLYPLDALLLAACLGMAWIDARRGRLASWKGRPILVDE
jgi:hypothetical protein